MIKRTLTVPGGQSASNALGFDDLRWAKSITFYPPASLTGTYTVEVSPERSGVTAADYRTLQSDGSDINLTADKALIIVDVGFYTLRLATTGTPGSDEEIEVIIHDES